MRAMPKRYKRRGSGRVFLVLLGLAGLGLGIWLFGRRGKDDWSARREEDGS
jgi:LPXTG-motif cell wall-anchored protein